MFSENNNILLIDDDLDILDAYTELLQQEGYHVVAIAEPGQVTDLIDSGWKGVVLCDVLLPNVSGLDLLQQFLQKDPELPVLMITGHGDMPMAVDAVKKGAFDFLEKPILPERLLDKVKEALRLRTTIIEQRQWQTKTLNAMFIGVSPWIKMLREQLRKLSASDIPVFLWGELGTGRHLAATYLHRLSIKSAEPLIIHECLPEQKIELMSLIEKVQQGTLILKNIHFLTPIEQIYLARQQQSDHRRFRLIIISDESLPMLVKQQNVVPELYYFFTHTQIHMLPLREHAVDIPEIFSHYVAQVRQRLNREVVPLRAKFLNSLMRREWIGNTRELINVAELYVIGLYLPSSDQSSVNKHKQSISLDEVVSSYEQQIIEDALYYYQGRVNEVAVYLGIPRKKLYLRMRKYGLDKHHYKEKF